MTAASTAGLDVPRLMCAIAQLQTSQLLCESAIMRWFKNGHGRFVPPREWELVHFGLALFVLASVPFAWLLHGFANDQEPWNVIPMAAVLTGCGLWLRRKRLANSQPISSGMKAR